MNGVDTIFIDVNGFWFCKDNTMFAFKGTFMRSILIIFEPLLLFLLQFIDIILLFIDIIRITYQNYTYFCSTD